MKGRSNYCASTGCKRRGHAGRAGPLRPRRPRRGGARGVPAVISEWAATTTTGDRAELRDLPEDLPLWGRFPRTPRLAWALSARATTSFRDADAAARGGVRRGDREPPPPVRRRRGAARLLREVIPRCPTLVVDERTSSRRGDEYFGVTFSNYRVDDRCATGPGAGRPHAGHRRNDDGRGRAGRSGDCPGSGLAWPSIPGAFSTSRRARALNTAPRSTRRYTAHRCRSRSNRARAGRRAGRPGGHVGAGAAGHVDSRPGSLGAGGNAGRRAGSCTRTSASCCGETIRIWSTRSRFVGAGVPAGIAGGRIRLCAKPCSIGSARWY